jgi:hypothetical protein
MTGRFDKLEEAMRGIDAATHARIDAKASDASNPPGPDETPGTDPFGPDPLGVNWAWLDAAAGSELPTSVPGMATTEANEPAGRPVPRPKQGRFSAARLSAFVALAASIGAIVFFLGFWSRGLDGNPSILLAAAEGKLETVRDGQKELQVRVRSDMNGFAAAVGLQQVAGPAIVRPDLGGNRVRANAGTLSEPVAFPENVRSVLVVVTATPAEQPIREFVRGKSYSRQDFDRLKADLTTYLRSLNYKDIAFGSVEQK